MLMARKPAASIHTEPASVARVVVSTLYMLIATYGVNSVRMQQSAVLTSTIIHSHATIAARNDTAMHSLFTGIL